VRFVLLETTDPRPGGELASLHWEGCRDIEKDMNKRPSKKTPVEAVHYGEVVEDWLADNAEHNVGTSDIRVHKCALPR
jgi:hypothetical protein